MIVLFMQETEGGHPHCNFHGIHHPPWMPRLLLLALCSPTAAAFALPTALNHVGLRSSHPLRPHRVLTSPLLSAIQPGNPIAQPEVSPHVQPVGRLDESDGARASSAAPAWAHDSSSLVWAVLLAFAVCAGGDIVQNGPGAGLSMVTEGIWNADYSNMFHLDYTPGMTTMRLRATCTIFETGVQFECDLPYF